MASIYSVEDLAKRAQAIFDEAHATKEPVYIAQNGNASIILIDADTYLNNMQALGEFERIYRDGVKPIPAKHEPMPDAEAVADDAEQPGKVYAWRCMVCGYVEYIDELPDDFVCPICGATKEQFERIEV